MKVVTDLMVRLTTRTLGTLLVAVGFLAMILVVPGGLVAHSPARAAPVAPTVHLAPVAGAHFAAVVSPHGPPSPPVTMTLVVTPLPGSNPIPATVGWTITSISGATVDPSNVSVSIALWSTASGSVLVANVTQAISAGVTAYNTTIDYSFLGAQNFGGGNFPTGAYQVVAWGTVLNSSNASVTPQTVQSAPMNTNFQVIDVLQSVQTNFSLYMQLPFTLNFTEKIGGTGGYTYSWNSTTTETPWENRGNASVSVEVRFIESGCGSQFGFGAPCESIANVSQTVQAPPTTATSQTFSVTIDKSFMSANNFVNGQYPEGEYQVIIWGTLMNASQPSAAPRTEGVAQNAYFVLSPLNASISAPLANANLTPGTIPISVTYVGNFINGANVTVTQGTTTVFVQGAFAPGFGLHAATVFWTENYGGQYKVTLTVSTQYTMKSWSETVNVTSSSGIVYVNHSAYQNSSILPGVSGPVTGALLLVIGLIVGMIVAFLLARMMWAAPAATPAQPWSGSKSTTECSICHQTFATEEELKEHSKTAHGMT